MSALDPSPINTLLLILLNQLHSVIDGLQIHGAIDVQTGVDSGLQTQTQLMFRRAIHREAFFHSLSQSTLEIGIEVLTQQRVEIAPFASFADSTDRSRDFAAAIAHTLA